MWWVKNTRPGDKAHSGQTTRCHDECNQWPLMHPCHSTLPSTSSLSVPPSLSSLSLPPVPLSHLSHPTLSACSCQK